MIHAIIEFVKKPSAFGWKAFFLAPILSLLASTTSGQGSYLSEKAFQTGEKLTYGVKYQWSGLWTRVAKVVFSVETDTLKDRTVYRFQGKGWTLPFYDAFFKVRDIYRSRATREKLYPLRFQRKVQEGKTRFEERYRFKREEDLILRRSTKDEKVQKIPYSRGVLDVLTAVYHCRSMELESLSKGDSVGLDLILGEEIHSTYFIYKGKVDFEGPNGNKHRCHYIEPELIAGSIFKEGDRMKVLVTADRRKLPLYVSSEIMVGKIKVYLSEFEGTIDP